MLTIEFSIPRSVDLARKLDVTKASVTKAVKGLEQRNLIQREAHGALLMTEADREIAAQIYERHCFFTDQLISAGVSPELAEHEACQMEHALSEDSFEKLKRFLCKNS